VIAIGLSFGPHDTHEMGHGLLSRSLNSLRIRQESE
jgi:hypothetical protein